MFPKRGAIAVITTFLALILLFNFKTPDQAAVGAISSTGGSAVATSPSSTGSTTAGAGTAAATPTAPTAPATAGSATAQTVTGTLVPTRYGDVEVQITVAGGKITAVDAIALPTGGRSGQISNSAAPILASEALSAQSANIDIVSGATYTSEAYAQSLQAALDQAGMAAITIAAA